MSGGFFRGTSADQDTRFSNKQAKLMKSQKFPPELEHLVDMSKVEMNVIRPWIASRVTELLGFEDEVLINFIYGLLDAKEVNGKEVQISLTGFMEKNTGKFMKELWTLLLSAQKNASGVPQQLLDAKGEEIKKKQAEQDRIVNEIQKKKEKESREFELERLKKMDGGVESKATNADLEPTSKHMLPKSSSARSKDEKETGERNGVRGRNRVSRSPHSVDRSPSSPRGSRSRSISKSHSNSRSYSNGRQRSASRSPEARGRSISPRRQSATPRRRHSSPVSLSPSRRKAFYSRRRSRSPRRSPSPMRRRLRSPFRRRSPSPVRRRRSPSPVRRRRSPSPVRRRRSPSPVRRRSPPPVRRRSPSPMRRRSPSPMRRRSPLPLRRRSPIPLRRRSPLPMRRRSPSPVRRRSPPVQRRSPPAQRRSPSPMRRRHQRSPSTPRRRSPSPMRHRSPIPGRRRSPTPPIHRSPSAYESSSPSRSPSPVRRSIKDRRRSPVRSPRERIRPSISLRSPQRDPQVRKDIHNKEPALSPSPEKSPILEESPARTRKRSAIEDRRSLSPYESPARQTRERMTGDGGSSPPRKPREQKPRHVSPEISKEEEENDRAREDGDRKSNSSQKRSLLSSTVNKQKDSPMKVHHREDYSPDRLAGCRATDSRNRLDNVESRKKDQEIKSEKNLGRGHPETPDQQRSPTIIGDRQRTSHSGDGKKSDERIRSRPNNVKESDGHHKSETVPMSVEKADPNNRSGTIDSGSEESGKHKSEGKEKRKHKRSERREVASDDDYSNDSEIEDRKEAKRRKKEEKKLRKEEKRWRREERRRKREERRAEKLKVKNQYDASASDGEHDRRKESHPSDDEVAESEQKKLEIELRKKALESLKAKKGISH